MNSIIIVSVIVITGLMCGILIYSLIMRNKKYRAREVQLKTYHEMMDDINRKKKQRMFKEEDKAKKTITDIEII